MSEVLPCVELESSAEPDSAIIWLHGLGADGHDFEPVVPRLGLSDLALRYVFPHAQKKSITINNGHEMPAWFDILEPGKERAINATQLLTGVAEIHRLVDREIERGISSERILLAGFSQGGAVALHAALTYDRPLGGLLLLSGWFPTAEAIEVHPANAGLAIDIHHGTQDPILPLSMGQSTVTHLATLGLEAKFHTYPMQHQVCAEEIGNIGSFINSRLG